MLRPSRSTTAPDGDTSAATARFLINDHPYRLRYFAAVPDGPTPAGTLVIPSDDGAGVFWVIPYAEEAPGLKILRPSENPCRRRVVEAERRRLAGITPESDASITSSLVKPSYLTMSAAHCSASLMGTGGASASSSMR